MDDSKCVSGERSMFLHTAGTQPSEWCKFLNQYQGTGLPQRYMLFVVERRTTSAENLRTEQNKLDYNALQQRWTHLLLGIYVHAFTLVNTNAYVEYTHTEEALLIFNQEWDVLETAIQDGSKSVEASQHVTVLGKNKDVILILPAVLQAVTNFYAVGKETFIINVENQQLAILLSKGDESSIPDHGRNEAFKTCAKRRR